MRSSGEASVNRAHLRAFGLTMHPGGLLEYCNAEVRGRAYLGESEERSHL